MIGKLKRLLKSSYKLAVEGGMKVGKGISVMGNVNFGSEPYLITLEDQVRISFGVAFVTHDGGTWAFRDQPEYSDIIKYGKIHVGERTFIGCNSTIMPGVTIGKRCVIGAGSVVTKDVPDGSVVAGVPARVIMTTEEYAQKSKAAMKPYDKEAYMQNKKAYLQEWL
ncbi:MAG: acyltransferase [Oscillospiraceae bacterium]|nr:acyltransferase [Oscillospiraceae bacterium]